MEVQWLDLIIHGYLSVLICYMHDLSVYWCQDLASLNEVYKPFFFFSDLDDKKGIWDKQQGLAVKHRELYSTTCDKP